MSPRIPDDLSWLALQYICDELSPPDRDAFERMLAEDQAAREAVAEAVECCSAVRVAYGEAACDGHAMPLAPPVSPAMPAPANSPLLKRRSGWRRSLSAVTWMVSGAAACLLALMALQSEPQSVHQPTPSAAETAQGVALAQAYVASEHVDVLQSWPGPVDASVDSADGSYSLEDEYSHLEHSGRAGSAFEVRQNTANDGGSSWAMEPLHSAGDDWMLALVALDGEDSPATVEQDH